MENGNTVDYSLDDIFRAAEEIERKGIAFYHEAATQAADPVTRQVFNGLAAMEREHQQIFQTLRQLVVPAPAAELNAVQDLFRHSFQNVDHELRELFDGKLSREDILKSAMDFEKDTIVFLSGLKHLVEPKDMPKIDLIIREELGHVVSLGSQLAGNKPC